MTAQESSKQINTSFLDSIIVKSLTSLDRGSFWAKDKILFFKELSYMLAGWVSLVESMNLLISASDNYAVKEIAKAVYGYLKKWKSLSYALNRLPDYFDEGDFAIVKSWEMSWTLANVLQSLSAEYIYVNDIKNKYIGAMAYPIVLLIISIVAIITLFLFVLPNICSIADSFQNVEMPLMTQILRNFSVFLQTQWQWLAWILAGLIFVWSIFFSTDSGQKTWFNILLSIPLIGRMTKYYYLVKWCRYMKLMLNSGMNYLQTFQLLRDILAIPAYSDMIERVLTGLQKGETIYDALKYESDIIPSDVTVMVKVGEETANLANSLDNVLKMYDTELNNIINSLAKVIEPIMLVFIWWIVVVIALWVFGLIFQIMQWVGM